MTKKDGDPVRYIDDCKMHSLMQYYKVLPDGPMRKVLELFLFSFHACGLRVKVYAKWLLPTLSKELKDRLSFLEYTID